MSDLETFHDEWCNETRVLGCLPSDPALKAATPTWTQAGNPVIPESDWVEFDLWPSEIKIKDQDGRGACNGHAAALSLELARYTAGMPHVPLSAWYVYAILCGGWDRGSNIGDALKLLSEQGTCPESDLEYGVINPRKISDAAKASAARFKIEAGTQLTTYDEIGSAVQLGRPMNLAVGVGAGFNSLDSDGCPRLSKMTNHAVCVAFGMKKSKGGDWLAKMPNSWSPKWGLDGFCWLPLKRLPDAWGFEAYDVAAAQDDPQDPTRPHVA